MSSIEEEKKNKRKWKNRRVYDASSFSSHALIMEGFQQVHELTTLYNEYKSFFPFCELKLTDASPEGCRENHIKLTTHEGLNTSITVGLKGWYEIPHPHKSYETFEALMQNISPDFLNRFGNELTNKLNNLLQWIY